jgi:hypothetical protein
MRILLLTLAVLLPLCAQQPGEGKKKGGPPGPPKNLKVLKPDTNLREVMTEYRVSLGVQCTGCHVKGDFASDENKHKDIARKMIVMTEEINAKFPDGKIHVTCFTCHRGEEHPQKDAPMPPPPPPAPAKP